MTADLDALPKALYATANAMEYEGELAGHEAMLMREAASALLALRQELANVNAGAADVVLALAVCNKERKAAEAERDEARKEIADHRCTLPSSISEALNSGDGTYRP